MYKNLKKEPEIDFRPILKLWFAVLKNAIKDYLKFKKYGFKNPNFREVYEWFTSDEDDIGSFKYICKLLNLNHHVIRREILRGVDPFKDLEIELDERERTCYKKEEDDDFSVVRISEI